jgi:hypothetical protein
MSRDRVEGQDFRNRFYFASREELAKAGCDSRKTLRSRNSTRRGDAGAWSVEGDDVQFGRQLYFALRDLESEGDFRCTISTESGELPEFSHKSAKVKCGKKALVIDLQKSQKQSEVVQLNEELDAR